jgi:hypothetical protein
MQIAKVLKMGLLLEGKSTLNDKIHQLWWFVIHNTTYSQTNPYLIVLLASVSQGKLNARRTQTLPHS